MEKQVVAQLTVGTVSGYNHDNSKAWSLAAFTTWLQEVMNEYSYNDSKKYISWLVFPAKAVYKKEWGSPISGEDVFAMQASYTEYDKDTSIDDWINNVKDCATEIKSRLQQSTVRLQFTESKVIIL